MGLYILVGTFNTTVVFYINLHGGTQSQVMLMWVGKHTFNGQMLFRGTLIIRSHTIPVLYGSSNDTVSYKKMSGSGPFLDQQKWLVIQGEQ